ncbi:MAG TPA: SDR family oxidoreductase [Candidatus Kapabacteria bacterium]|jgi:NAD(P)-dependent dehydrogenase (short-subunit alcohol dehydrogenase family)|nr:SDR family oxidoreductase [Candidatus Kapabacteria bacterium]
MSRLQDRVAIVTGAAVGNGQAFCQRLAEDGARIMIADIADASEAMELVRASGGEIDAVRVDATDEQQTQKMVRKTIERYGRVDVLVNNVGLYQEEPFELISYDEWKRMLSVNLDSLFLTSRAVLPAMKEQGFGRIVALSSDTIWLGTPYLVHYVAAKMGVIGFVRSLASEIGRYGITINAVTVGLTATQRPPGEKLIGSILEHLLPQQAVQRGDEPEDIAEVVAFLASPESSIITGQTINVDGGVARH